MSNSSSTLSRYEIKFVTESFHYHNILNWLNQHNSYLKIEYPDRQVNNIYFDSYNYNSYCENIYGSSIKSKVRFRWYGSSEEPKVGSLEIKCKRNQLNRKLIYKIQEDIQKNGGNWKSIQSEIQRQVPAEGKKWMDINPLPILINRYKRKYLISGDRKVRVTLDSNLKIFDQSRKPFPNYLLKSNLPEVIVMEIKFPKSLRDHVVQTFRDVPMRSSRFSKYVNGVISTNG